MKYILFVLVAVAGCGGGSTAETCTLATCTLGGHSYKFCNGANASSCRYVTSDNTIYACHSCSDCSNAASAIASWCATGTTSATGSTSSATGSTSSATGSTSSATGSTSSATGSTTSATGASTSANGGTVGSTSSATGSTTSATGSTTGTTPTGCSGLSVCVMGCGTDQTCGDTCFNNATDNAITLFNQATLYCPMQAFCGSSHAAPIPCTSADLDPTSSAPLTAACNTCLNAVTDTQFQTACASDIQACENDTP